MLDLDGQVHHDTHAVPMGNYVIEVGNYVIATPSELGNYKIADNYSLAGGRLPGEHCLSLVWAVLDRAPAGWREFIMTPAGLRRLQDLRRRLLEPPASLRRGSPPGQDTVPGQGAAVA